MPTHDCQHCEDRLLDLLYDELDEAEARSVREELSSCEACAGSWERLQGGHMFASHLTLDEPPPALDLAILEAAHAKVSGAPAVARATPDLGPGIWEQVLDYLRRFAAGPQVAMATVMLLVVAIGLWYVPTDQRRAEVVGETVMTADPESEAVATLPAAAVPNQVPALAEVAEAAPTGARQQGRRERAAQDSGRVLEPLVQVEQTSGAVAETPAPAPAFGLGGAGLGGTGLGGTGLGGAAPNERARLAAAADAVLDDAMMNMADEAQPAVEAEAAVAAPSASQSVRRGEMPQAAPAMASRMAAAPTDLRALPRPEAREGRSSSAPRTSGSARIPMGQGSRQNYDQGLSEYRNRNYAGAIRELDQVVRRPGSEVRTLVPSALHHVARSYRSQGNCRQAVVRYEDLLRRFTSYPQAPRAMIEVADCYRRLGNTSQARAMLERASRHRSVQPDAVRELRRLDPVEEQRQRRVRSPSRSAPSPSAAPAEAEQAYDAF